MLAVKTYSNKDLVDIYADVTIDGISLTSPVQNSGEMEVWLGALGKQEAIDMLEGMLKQIRGN